MRSLPLAGIGVAAVLACNCGGSAAATPGNAADAASGGNPSAGAPPDGGSDAGAPDSGTPDSGPAGPTLAFAPTGASGCDAFAPHVDAAPIVAPSGNVASCGAPFDGDVHGHALFVCANDSGGWTAKLVDGAGAVVRAFDSGDAGPPDAWAAAAQDGVVGLVDSPAGGGQFSFADGKSGFLWTSGHPGVAYDYEAGILTVDRSQAQGTWQRHDDLGSPLTQEQALPTALATAAYSVSIDVRGNVLAAWQAQPGAEVQAQWFGPDLGPLGTAFSPGWTAWPQLESMAGGGFGLSAAADNLDSWTGILKPGQSGIEPVPSLRLDRGTRAFWTVFSGQAYAFADATCPNASWPCPTGSAEIVATDGTSCGVLTLRNPDGSAGPFVLTRGGTILDAQQTSAGWRWWPGVLR